MAGSPEPVAILGIGAMGHGLATSTLRSGIPTIVWNRTTEATRDLVELGAEAADSPADAAERASVVVTMVTNTDAVLAIAVDQGMLAALAPGAVWAQMSTIGPGGIAKVAGLVERERPDVVLLDAPVSGSKDPAENGLLTVFASGPDEARSRVTPLFDAIGHRTIWVGALGAGSRLKLVNNTWLAFTAEAVASSMALARSVGSRHGRRGGCPARRTAGGSLAGCQARTDRQGGLLQPVCPVIGTEGRPFGHRSGGRFPLRDSRLPGRRVAARPSRRALGTRT